MSILTLDELVRVRGTADLRPLSPSAAKLAAVVSSPDSTVDDVSDVIRYDEAMTADVLRLANSVMAASLRTISTVRDAVIRLGGGRILERLVGAHVRACMNTPLEFYGFAENELWRHSVASACAAEMLDRFVPRRVSGASFTAALLHDIGKLLIVRAAPEAELARIWELVFQKGITSDQAEAAVLGFSHAQAGAMLCEQWGLPEQMTKAIRDHHALDGGHEALTDDVRIANVVARSIGEGVGNEGMSFSLDTGLAARLGITRDAFEKLCLETRMRFDDVAAAFGG